MTAVQVECSECAEFLESFERFVAENRRPLHSQMRAVTRRSDEADEAVAEAFARAWERWDELREYDDPAAWLRTVAWRLAVNGRRTETRRRDLLVRYARFPEQPGPSVDRVLVTDALRTLPPDQREALVLHYYGGLRVSDIAQRLDVPEGTVKARLTRGRRALASLLDDSTPRAVTTVPAA